VSPTAPRYLYLARHAEATEDETALTDRGRVQATALGTRLRAVPLAAITHGPLPRAAETATLAAAQLGGGVPVEAAAEAGDYIPYLRHLGADLAWTGFPADLAV